jgi:hypothetical protein
MIPADSSSRGPFGRRPRLFLPIGAEEKLMFDAIDGRRNIAEIIEQTKQSAAAAQVFFEKLWWYDQVVFDNSQS